jgi:serine/threonine-protein kinase RsbW
MEKIRLEIPKKPEFISCLRLFSSSISNIYDLDIEKIEDVKIIISEICTFFINNIKKNTEGFLLEYFLEDDKITVEITDKNDEKLSDNIISENEMFTLIIDSLADKCNIDILNNKVVFETRIIE